MRNLEDRVSPMLKTMMIGNDYEISARENFALRRWAIKTAAVFEAFDGQVGTSDQLRRSLRNGHSPQNVAVVLGHYEGEIATMHSRYLFADPLSNNQTMTWVTLVVGRVLLFVFNEFTRHREVNLGPTPQHTLCSCRICRPLWSHGRPVQL